MSDCNKPSCSRSSRDASCSGRPRHVRRLNFGRSILELDVVRQCTITNRTLVIGHGVTRIPCTEKKDYVRKWLEIHEDDGCDVTSSNDLSRLSPVLGTSANKVTEKSPVLGGNSRKRSRREICINRQATVKRLDNVDCQENVEHSANCTIQSNIDCKNKERNKNEQERLSEIQFTPPCIERVVDEMSPVLSTHRVHEKKRRKLQLEDGISPKDLKLGDSRITSTNINSLTEPDNNCNTLREIPVGYDKLEENFVTKVKATLFLTETKKDLRKCQRGTLLSPTQERSNFEDSNSSSNTNKDNPKIEIDTSDDNKDEERNELSSTYSSSDNNLNNLIEDTDTQENTRISQFSVPNKSLIPSKLSCSQLAVDDLDETYCSEAEMIQDESIHLSAKISQVTSLNKITQKTGSKSTQTDVIISTITTPSKKSPNKNMYARLLDSGKKRRKPKKGSMVAKLHSLINAQVSSIRIWRHQMNKQHETASTRFISVYVRSCTKQFGNQFLDGILLEDRLNLLQSDVEIEEAETHDAQAGPKETLYKNIMIMLVCDIVGSLKMISDVVINVYPPWNILDKDDLTLEATYVSISDNQEVPDIKNKDNSRKRERRVIKEFNCPCIEEQRELPFCARKPSNDKPDVMQRIFDF